MSQRVLATLPLSGFLPMVATILIPLENAVAGGYGKFSIGNFYRVSLPSKLAKVTDK
jgi:hypothetical protein